MYVLYLWYVFIYGMYSLQRWSWKKYNTERLFTPWTCNYAVALQISHFLLFFSLLKQNSTGVWNSADLFCIYSHLNHANLNKFWNLGDQNWCVNDCNFKILFLIWRSIARSNNIMISKKYLIKFFHNWKPSNAILASIAFPLKNVFLR